MPRATDNAAAIVAAARVVIAERGPEKLRLAAVAEAAGVSRPTLYRWFPTKDDLLAAIAEAEIARFDEGLATLVAAQRTPARRLDAALRYLITYLDGQLGTDPVGVDPTFALRTLNVSMPDQVTVLVRLLGNAMDLVPAVARGQLTREQAAEVFLRLTYSHYLIPGADPEQMLATIRAAVGLPRRSLSRAAS